MEFFFILVEPAVPENIGAAARGLKAMGFTRLRLVAPQADHFDVKARMLAYGSLDVLKKAEVYATLKEAAADLELVVGTSSKARKTHVDVLPGNALPAYFEKKVRHVRNAGIVFGSEKKGLSNEHLKECDLLSRLPLNRPNPSLNLAQSVMLYAYLLSPLHQRGKAPVTNRSKAINSRELKVRIRRILNAVLDGPHQDTLGGRILERISFLSDDDLQLVYSLCHAFIEKFPEPGKK